jgi:serine/threonine protein kinase
MTFRPRMARVSYVQTIPRIWHCVNPVRMILSKAADHQQLVAFKTMMERYTLGRKLGEGAFGVVFFAIKKSTGEEV